MKRTPRFKRLKLRVSLAALQTQDGSQEAAAVIPKLVPVEGSFPSLAALRQKT
jgi:hypothetical protein